MKLAIIMRTHIVVFRRISSVGGHRWSRTSTDTMGRMDMFRTQFRYTGSQTAAHRCNGTHGRCAAYLYPHAIRKNIVLRIAIHQYIGSRGRCAIKRKHAAPMHWIADYHPSMHWIAWALCRIVSYFTQSRCTGSQTAAHQYSGPHERSVNNR